MTITRLKPDRRPARGQQLHLPTSRPASFQRVALAVEMHWPSLVVIASGIAGFAWMAWLGLAKAHGLTTGAFDQAYFQQLVWSIGVGRGFTSSFNPGSFLGLHFSPLLVVPAALERIWPDVRLLTLLQSAALGLAVPAAYLFLRTLLAGGRTRPAHATSPGHGPAALAAALAAPMPVWPILQQQVRADFHTEALALPLILLAGWAGLTNRAVLMFGLAAAALMAKEDQAYPVAVIGLLVAARARGSLRLRGGPRRAGLALLGLAVGWGVCVFMIVKPYLRNGVAYDTDRYYAWLGGGASVLAAPFQQTQAVLAALTRAEGWLVAGWLVVSLAGLGLLRPRWLVLITPPLAAHLLSSQVPQQQVQAQYGLLLLVPAVVAAGLGGRRLLAAWLRRSRRRRWPAGQAPGWPGRPLPLRRTRAVAILSVPALVAAFQAGAVPPFTQQDLAFWDRPPAMEPVRAAIATVPPDADLSVDWGVAAAVANRPVLHVLPYDHPDAYVLVDGRAFVTGTFQWEDRPAFIARLATSGRPLLVNDGRFLLWGPVP